MIEIELFKAEAELLLRKTQLALMPTVAAPVIAEGLRHKFHEQQNTAFRAGGAGDTWPGLSDWAVKVRGTAEPILVRTGSFQAQVAAFRGTLVEDADGFDFVYPGVSEADGRYFGITAGQKVNPLARRSGRPGPRGGTSGNHDTPIPMAMVPRPVLFGEQRIAVDATEVLQAFLVRAGLFVGGGAE